jgi:hypothetical protein
MSTQLLEWRLLEGTTLYMILLAANSFKVFHSLALIDIGLGLDLRITGTLGYIHSKKNQPKYNHCFVLVQKCLKRYPYEVIYLK